MKARAIRRPIAGFLFTLPWLIGFLIFTAGPMLASLYISFTTYDLAEMKWVGGRNYQRLLFEDPLFWKSLQVTITYAIFSVPLGLAGSLALAILLNQKVRGQRVFRTLFYLPSLVPVAASALLWAWIFNSDYGLLNWMLGLFGFSGAEWLADEKYTLWAFIVMSLWGIGGGRMIIFLAGLQGISESYYEAAKIDGASPWQQFRFVTLPQLSPVIFFNLILGVIGSFQVFTQAYMMTSGGPNNATLFYALMLFRNAFEYFKLGKASAMAWILFVILLLITALQFWGAKRWVHYEAEAK